MHKMWVKCTSLHSGAIRPAKKYCIVVPKYFNSLPFFAAAHTQITVLDQVSVVAATAVPASVEFHCAKPHLRDAAAEIMRGRKAGKQT